MFGSLLVEMFPENFGGVAFWEEVCHWEWPCSFKSQCRQAFFSKSQVCGSEVASQLLPQNQACLPAAILAAMTTIHESSETSVMAFHHSKNK